MRVENAQLRARMVEMERDYFRITRLNEVYREELIDHRRRLGLPVDNLIGLSDPLSQPTHIRSSTSAISNASSPSPSNSVFHLPTHASRAAHGVPIPRPTPQSHRPIVMSSSGNTPLSHSPSSSDSPFPFSPAASVNPASFLSNDTQLTSPSSASVASNPGTYGTASRGLTYPSVPPPSLSSSFGSPSVSYFMSHRDRDASLSPVEPLSRRNSNAQSRGSAGAGARVAETGSLRALSRSHSRRGSIDRGVRVAESGTLFQRSRASSQSLPPTDEAGTETDGSADGSVEREHEHQHGLMINRLNNFN
ncbi:hypothetical protein HGRIS_000162 [Hohenbuehelia grisea]